MINENSDNEMIVGESRSNHTKRFSSDGIQKLKKKKECIGSYTYLLIINNIHKTALCVNVCIDVSSKIILNYCSWLMCSETLRRKILYCYVIVS